MFYPTLFSRRDALKTAACGFGYLALAGLMQQAAAQEAGYSSPVAPKSPHFAPRAKRVIFLFMQGGPSHVDTFDYKPKLITDDGKQSGRGRLMASPFKFSRHGQSGLYVSELFPNVAKHADDLCILNGMNCDNPAHPQATIQLHTGNPRFVRPSIGSWVLYGLGTTNANLPGFITINPVTGVGGAQNYGAGFLPAAYEGTRIDGRLGNALPNLASPNLSTPQQRKQLDLVQSMNKDLLKRAGQNEQIEGLIESYELGFRMQSAVPDVMDLSKEGAKTKELYGIGNGQPSDTFGRQCLLARRFAEAGVRFIEVTHQGWDQHAQLVNKLTSNCRETDQPIAGLLTDLKQRGMLDDTLVIWGGEFGRTPTNQGARDGRDHNNRGYSMWMAGGGVRGGMTFGATDEHGATAVDGKTHVHDLHATVLHLLGLDHERLTYRYAGRNFRLTDVHGRLVDELIA